MIIQCESRSNKNRQFLGFQSADEQILKIMCFYLQMKFERKHSLNEVKKREQQVINTLRLTSEICPQRHHEGLFRKLRENLPSFFGFEAVGILMYDYKKDDFFTDPDISKDVKKKHGEESSMSDNEMSDDSDKLSIGSGDVNSPVSLVEPQVPKKKKENINEYCQEVELTEEQKELIK